MNTNKTQKFTKIYCCCHNEQIIFSGLFCRPLFENGGSWQMKVQMAKSTVAQQRRIFEKRAITFAVVRGCDLNKLAPYL